MLLQIAATFSCCLLVTVSCKGIKSGLYSKNVTLQNTGIYRIYNPQAFSNTLASLGTPAQGLRVINSADSCVSSLTIIYVVGLIAKHGQCIANNSEL